MPIQSMRMTEALNASRTACCSRSRIRVKFIIGMLIVLVFLAAICGYYIGVGTGAKGPSQPPDPVHPPGPSSSKLYTFQKAAVCTDAPDCSKIGREILNKNGSAVDATIAAMFCNGFHNQQSMGLGGGFFMTVYIKADRKAYTVNAREKAPGLASENMFNDKHEDIYRGPISVGVPGEVRGMWLAHQRWGVLPWAELMQPTLDICKNGFTMSKALNDGLHTASIIINDSQLRKVYYDEKKKAFKPTGSFIKPGEALCRTLARIAEKGGDEFYNGSLAADLVDDLKMYGTIITAEDLANYQALIRPPVAVYLPNGDVVYSPPSPGSGLILAYILNVLKGYNFNHESIDTTEERILTFHRIVEAFKYAYAARTELGDEDFIDLEELQRNITSPEFGEKIRLLINDFVTSNDSKTYGASTYTKDDTGTAHISIIGPNGDAVSVTSSINFYFGTGASAMKTGVILNNVMDDFAIPGMNNYFGIEPSPANFIRPGKRPLSSMNPAIVVDVYGNVKMVLGASGGTKITSAVALAIMRKLWFGQDVKQIVDAPRFHHQVFPMEIQYEYGIIEDVVSGLKAKGHEMTRYTGRGSIICALYKNETGIYGNSDFRKGGIVSGIN